MYEKVLDEAEEEECVTSSRRMRLQAAIESVANKHTISEKSKQIRIVYEEKYGEEGWIWVKRIDESSVSVDLLAFSVRSQSREDEEMEVQIACCNSRIENASKQHLDLVKSKLEEIIDSSTAMLDEDFPIEGGLRGLRSVLLTDGSQQLGDCV